MRSSFFDLVFFVVDSPPSLLPSSSTTHLHHHYHHQRSSLVTKIIAMMVLIMMIRTTTSEESNATSSSSSSSSSSSLSSNFKPKLEPNLAFKCKKSFLDHCTQKLLMITDKNFHYPETLDEMNKRCKDMKSLEKCVKRYSQKCLPNSIQRHSFALLTYGAAKTNKAICRNSKRRKAFAAFGSSCANRLQTIMNKYVDDMNRALFGILEYPNKKLRIPLSCCNYYKFQDRVLEMYMDECPQHVMEIERLLVGFARDSFAFLCGPYVRKSERCAKIISKTPKWDKPMNEENLISNYVDMIENFIE